MLQNEFWSRVFIFVPTATKNDGRRSTRNDSWRRSISKSKMVSTAYAYLAARAEMAPSGPPLIPHQPLLDCAPRTRSSMSSTARLASASFCASRARSTTLVLGPCC